MGRRMDRESVGSSGGLMEVPRTLSLESRTVCVIGTLPGRLWHG